MSTLHVLLRMPERLAYDFFFFGVAFFLLVLPAAFFALGFLSPKTLSHCSVNFLDGPERTIGPDISNKLLVSSYKTSLQQPLILSHSLFNSRPDLVSG